MIGRTALRRRGLIWTVLAVVVVVGGAVVAYYTPLMSVRSTEVLDNRVVSESEILAVADVTQGTPLLRVDTAAVARRVAAIESIESARVQRSYPSTLTISVVERRPVVRIVDGGTTQILDRLGVAYLTFGEGTTIPAEFAALPRFTTAHPGPTDPTTKAAVSVVADLPAYLTRLLVSVAATSPVDIELALKGERTVVWGDSDRGEEKARALKNLLTRKGTLYNVSSPDFPAFK
ncbi:FtsQ-type POTRA domain-containing protein [Gordonia pseudamarae]|jgi:cell division protein FtsQ|uniref:FtsQ-type POTRA domain-containing protein n=1 Tax=Gordonia pseudamarae TaxID=2831662 RepID=A0ABX6IIH8_9ACTN|nr:MULTISPECIES: FtsQ-type POTRA domain-containing protein [Gordonia]MBD0022653.1 FtsQ-type POTRA domain-containing protein [Gordonia sp. (in: high G+C Gram-positive bacteria)]QHN26793.1 FtsQ-type POTRA domain-containing protein [Gordonia pseudamarae]QHN35685.1 FtsQ-type POTRA domain-containing protein [Gordonia pseudamarae]